MFKVGDRVRDTDFNTNETVKTVRLEAFITTEEFPNTEYPATQFELYAPEPVFPRTGARVTRKERSNFGSNEGVLEPVCYNNRWYIKFDEGDIIEVHADYLARHYDEVKFPYVGAKFQRKVPQPYLFNTGVITSVGRMVGVKWDDGHAVTFPRDDFLARFKEA